MHCHPFAAGHPCLVHHRAEGGGETAAEAGSGRIVDGLGQVHEVLVGVVDRDIFGKRAPMGEARLELLFANLLVAGAALTAMAAAGDEWHRHALAFAEAAHALAHGHDRAGKLMARHMRQPDIGVMPHPAMPVAAAQARRLHLDHHAALRGRRVRQVADIGRGFEGFEIHGAHGCLLLPSIACGPQPLNRITHDKT